jgi:hypothetical protein
MMNLVDFGRPFKPGDVPEEDIRDELLKMENNPELKTMIKIRN